MHAGARADVDDMVGGADGVLVVLHHQYRVTQITQAGQGGQQALVVALVQTDGRLVEHVHDAHQAGADLAGQANALGFTAGQGLGAALQVQIVQTHIDQKLQPVADLLENLLGDFAAVAGQLQVVEIVERLAHRQTHQLGQGGVVDKDVTGRLAQAGAVAARAGGGGQVVGQVLAHRLGLGFPVAALHIGHDALERVVALDDVAPVVQVAELHALLAGAVENLAAHRFIQILERHIHVEIQALRQGGEHLEIVDVAAVPAANRPLRQGQLLAGDHLVLVEELLHAQTVAAGASPRRVIEREQARLQLRNRVPAVGAGELRGEGDLLAVAVQGRAVHGRDDGDIVGQIEGGLEGLRQPVLQVRAHLEAVHHHLDGVLLVLVQLRGVVHIVDTAVHPHADKALGAQLVEQMQVLALLLANHRGQQHQLAAFLHGQHLIHHLADGLRGQRCFVLRAARLTHPGEQQPQVIVDFGDGAHRGARVMAGGLLLDGDRRAQPLDMVHIGLLHHRQELPGIGGQRFHVTALAFGVQGVERQRRFPGPGKSGDHHQLVTGNVEVHVFQVMGASAPNQNGIHEMACPWLLSE